MTQSRIGTCDRQAHMEVVFLDVGHGCCTIVVTPRERRVVLVDCSAGAGPRTIRYLDARALRSPDVICISHLHDDHVAGFANIFLHLIQSERHVERVYTNYVGSTSRKGSSNGGQAVVQQLRDLLDGEDERLRDFRSDEASYELDGVILTVLHPSKFDLHEHQDRDDMLNNLSGVLRLDYGKSSVLLPGDIEGWAASRLVSQEPPRLNASLMLFPHHGAGWDHLTPSGAKKRQHEQEIVSPSDFIRAVGPSWTVLSVGSDNAGNWEHYGHPRQPVLDLLRHHHAGRGGFACTEVTPRCDDDARPHVQDASSRVPVAVPCGGSIGFDLGADGSVVMHPRIQQEWQSVVDKLPHPQCRS